MIQREEEREIETHIKEVRWRQAESEGGVTINVYIWGEVLIKVLIRKNN
jgi:hypothetical protein